MFHVKHCTNRSLSGQVIWFEPIELRPLCVDVEILHLIIAGLRKTWFKYNCIWGNICSLHLK